MQSRNNLIIHGMHMYVPKQFSFVCEMLKVPQLQRTDLFVIVRINEKIALNNCCRIEGIQSHLLCAVVNTHVETCLNPVFLLCLPLSRRMTFGHYGPWDLLYIKKLENLKILKGKNR